MVEPVRVLIVDDRHHKLVALQAVLEAPDVEIICAQSGREALELSAVLDFAVILLDINMPVMDGFETASQIRGREDGRRIPIIFLTAGDDELHVLRSYSLGAVDHLLTPVRPEVLRAKVAVFVELARKNREIQQQARSLERRAAQLQQLAGASVRISSEALNLEQKLQLLVDTARNTIGAHQASVVASITIPQRRSPQTLSAWSLSPEYDHRRDQMDENAAWRSLPLLGQASTVRLPKAVLPRGGHDQNGGAPAEGALGTDQGLLAAQLVDAGARIGVFEVCHKRIGEFHEDDEAILVQLAQLASATLQACIHQGGREADKNKDAFLGNLSHELRVPLHAILGWTQHLRDQLAEGGDLHHGLDVIERNAKAQSALVEDLLDVSRITSGTLRIERRRVSIPTLLKEVVEACRPLAAEKQLDVVLNVAEQVQPVLGDPNRLRQAHSNLLSNAIKFTPHGRSITIDVRNRARCVEIRVRDTGQGICPEFLPYVFERFAQGTRNGERRRGLGLGLAIVRHIVELHGGRVAASSEGVGRGATFTVRIPYDRPSTLDSKTENERLNREWSTTTPP